MSTNPHLSTEVPFLAKENSEKVPSLTIADGKKVKAGEIVIDSASGVEGKLTFSVWAWIVEWEDQMKTIVIDPLQLKSK